MMMMMIMMMNNDKHMIVIIKYDCVAAAAADDDDDDDDNNGWLPPHCRHTMILKHTEVLAALASPLGTSDCQGHWWCSQNMLVASRINVSSMTWFSCQVHLLHHVLECTFVWCYLYFFCTVVVGSMLSPYCICVGIDAWAQTTFVMCSAQKSKLLQSR